MTQKASIFTFLLKNPNVRPIDIALALDIKPPSVRRALFELRKLMIVSKPRKDQTSNIRETIQTEDFEVELQQKKKIKLEEPRIFWRKIVKTSASERRTSKRIRIWALTYEDNKIDRFDFLVDKIRDAFPQAEGITEFNYSDGKKFSQVPFEFPEFEVGQE